MRDSANFYRQGLSIFVGISLFLLVAFTLEKTGIPRGYTIALTACALFAIWFIAVIPGSTTTASKFFFTNKSTRSTVNALAMTTCVSFPILLGDGAGLFFSNPSFFVVIFVSLIVGIALSALLAARSFRQTGAIDTAHLLIHRFDSSLTARCVAVAVALSGFFLAVCGIVIVFNGFIWFFGFSEIAAISLAIGATVLTIILGGANSSTRLAAIAAILLLTALNLPLVLNSLTYSNFPLGHFTFGSGALSEMWDLEDQLVSLQIPKLADVLTPISPLLSLAGGQQIVAGLVIVAAVIFFPAMIHQSGTTRSSMDANSSSQKTILFVGLLGASFCAFLAFTQFGLYQTILGLPLSEARVAAPFLFSWGERSIDFVTVCGTAISTESDLIDACPDGFEHVLNIQDISLDSRLLLMGAPDLTALPFAYTALITSAVLLTGIGFSSMVILATSNNIVSAFYGTSQGVVASTRIFYTRTLSILFIVVAAAYASYYDFDAVKLFFLSMSVLASTLFPAMIAAFFLPQARSVHAASAVTVGLMIAILYFVLSKFGIDFVQATNDELLITLPGMQSAIPPELSAIFAVPISLIILIIGVLISSTTSLQNSETSAESD